jgi:hypothetical protein
MTQIPSKRVRASLLEASPGQASCPPQRPYHPAAMLPLVSKGMYEADREAAASSTATHRANPAGCVLPMSRTGAATESPPGKAAIVFRYHRSGKC